jgi:hypothetical protein
MHSNHFRSLVENTVRLDKGNDHIFLVCMYVHAQELPQPIGHHHEAKELCSKKTEVVKILDLAVVSVLSKGLNFAHILNPKSIREVISVMEKQYNIS